MPTPTVGQTVTFKWSMDPQADTATGIAALVVGGRVLVLDVRDIGTAGGQWRSTPVDVPVGAILTAT